MNKFLLLLSAFYFSASVFAQHQITEGYYRVSNLKELRYIYVTDNTGSATASKQDFNAILLFKNLNRAISNPASVLHIVPTSNSDYYDVQAQGTGIHDIIGLYPYIIWNDTYQAYQVQAQVSGITKYLGSQNSDRSEYGYISLDASGARTAWVVDPITTDGDNYFGFAPTVEIDGKYYQTFFAEFAFKFASDGMKAYYVSSANSAYNLVPIEEEVIPEKTPVIIECSSQEPTDNRIEILSTGGTAITDNQLKGVYFCNEDRYKDRKGNIISKDACTPNDASTVRVLGKTDEGKLGFVTSTETYIPANQAYLAVAAGSNSTIDLDIVSSINSTIADRVVAGVYSVLGVKLNDTGNINNLPAGIYIVNGKKVVKK